MTRHFAVACLAKVFVAAFVVQSTAQEVPEPTGPVILTVSGQIDVTNVGDTLQFDRDAFAQLDQSQITTTTIWTDGRHEFQGVSLLSLTDILGVSNGTLLAKAVNDYSVEIPVSDAVEGGPIIAYKMDGEVMSVRDKGPLWVVYPYDSSPDYRTAVIHARSIWQLDRIEVVE